MCIHMHLHRRQFITTNVAKMIQDMIVSCFLHLINFMNSEFFRKILLFKFDLIQAFSVHYWVLNWAVMDTGSIYLAMCQKSNL